ncbi:MAG: DUF883 C-terminal domain-containing protein [Methylicorpusculum sp.]|uniref:DUF883 family protein n=1 Tax=Methylicorpusculum sp. TaxID=2713644 RepID=UPI00271AABCF|nr:DUF883 C-terminal domain-containing protein [Methylicorpusculum sp.]MDO8843090.1 DUF883 C-terminal domain-containing protein [Methylicorpusculum sp.]MDO8939777.1 DUF883 C-terminal domain-containing protein [Methylicorpusculum sp.]MDP2201420.1 DUF883 C-terminal domain-containing protein [Methylicorpusculum sp.]
MDTIKNAANSAHETVDKIANATNQAAEALGEKGEQLKNCEQQLVENCRSYVHENPLTALGIAAAAGFVLSRLLSRR